MNDHIPPHRSHFSWSLPLALELGGHFMSTSVVTLMKEFSITRPASRARRRSSVGGTVFIAFRFQSSRVPRLRTINIKIFYIGLKSKPLLLKQIKKSSALNGLAPLNNTTYHTFSGLINTLGVAVPTSHHWPLGDEGKQAKSHGGVSGPPPYFGTK